MNQLKNLLKLTIKIVKLNYFYNQELNRYKKHKYINNKTSKISI